MKIIKAIILFCMMSTITVAQTENITTQQKDNSSTIDFSKIPKRINNKYPLSDQNNKGKWSLNNSFSDEFNDSVLDSEKWFDTNPGWIGRKPTFFHKSNVSLKDGNLVLSLNKHGDSSLPNDYTHSSGYVKSKEAFLYGYIEARLKPINAPWVTGFWLYNSQPDWWTEIDICENCPGVEKNRQIINSNLHVFKSPKDKGHIVEHISFGKKYKINFKLQKDYHVWGLEWTKDIIRFYIDGVMFREEKNTYWHQPLFINLNNESNEWFGALPDDSKLNEKYLVDYVRLWQ